MIFIVKLFCLLVGVTELLMAPGKYPNSSGTRNLHDNLSDLKAQVAANQKVSILLLVVYPRSQALQSASGRGGEGEPGISRVMNVCKFQTRVAP